MIGEPDIPELSRAQFQRFATLIHETASIRLRENKLTLLSNRLRKRLRALQMTDFDEYYALLTGKDAGGERTFFLEVITTNETYFWRTETNFRLLTESLLPELLGMFRGEELRFWSAGCSTGEEPYNLVMELTESMKARGVFPYSVLASDISQRVVDFARAGRYSGRRIERVPPAMLGRYFRPVPDLPGEYEVRGDIRDRVDFFVENLFEAGHRNLHCILCRNVMIYFDRDSQQKLATHFHNMLQPGGFLMIGHSESLHMMDTPFESVFHEQGIVYRRAVSG